jgi:hypothetical protein
MRPAEFKGTEVGEIKARQWEGPLDQRDSESQQSVANVYCKSSFPGELSGGDQ